MKKIVVIGSSNIDYLGISSNELIPNDSNIGKIKVSHGGVGRNITENLLRLDQDVTFITTIGNDMNGINLEKELLMLGCKVIKPNSYDLNTSSYCAIIDNNGNMNVAICDTEIMKYLDCSFLDKQDKVIEEADYLVFDGNLSDDVISYLFTKYKHKKIIVDGISTTKVKKFLHYLQYIYIIKVNEYEYQVIKNENKATYTIVTNGKNPVECISDTTIRVTVPDTPNIVNTTGAGDSFLSGVIYALVNDKDLQTAIMIGNYLASLTIQTEDTVCKKISQRMIKNI